MHVIVEGCDGTGKTTLCHLLSLVTDWPVVHQATHRPESFEDFAEMCDRAMARSTWDNLISDRWPLISNLCYEETGFDNSIERVVASLRDARVDRVIHCDVNCVEDLRIEPRPGDAKDIEQSDRVRARALQILSAYRELMNALRYHGFDVRRYVMLTRNR